MMQGYDHLQGINNDYTSTKNELPINIIIGASEYSRIKLPSMPRVGTFGEPEAGITVLGWKINLIVISWRICLPIARLNDLLPLNI